METKRKAAKKDWACQECGRRMTLRAAEKAMSVGCPGCGGSDVDLAPASAVEKRCWAGAAALNNRHED